MDEDGFWKIVQRAHDSSGGDMDQKCDALRQQIAVLSKDEALEFARLFNEKMDQAYDWPLWGAAYVINGGCSDDTFSDFRAALIEQIGGFDRAVETRDLHSSVPTPEFHYYDHFLRALETLLVARNIIAPGELIERVHAFEDRPEGHDHAHVHAHHHHH